VPKGQRNGACGGSYQGWCEVYPNEKKCVWVQAYDRLKPYHEENNLAAYIVPPCNWTCGRPLPGSISTWAGIIRQKDWVSNLPPKKLPRKRLRKLLKNRNRRIPCRTLKNASLSGPSPAEKRKR